MEFRDFAYWLQGFFEIEKPNMINIDQTQMIRAHLDSCFEHAVKVPQSSSSGIGSSSSKGYTCGTAGVDGTWGNGEDLHLKTAISYGGLGTAGTSGIQGHHKYYNDY